MTKPKRTPARRAAAPRPTPTTVEDASPSLLAKLGGEIRTIALWIGGVSVAFIAVWNGLDKLGEWRSAYDASTAKLTSVERQMGEVSTALAQLERSQSNLLPRVVALEALRAEFALLQQRTQANETEIATARSTRNQQYEGLRERVGAMERSDTDQGKAYGELARALSAIDTLLKGLDRRVEGMERRLERSFVLPPPTQRGGVEPESPAVWLLPHSGA